MLKPFRHARTVSALITSAAVIGPVAAAQASDASLRAIVKSDIPKITRSQAKILNGLATYEKSRSATAVIKAIKAQDRDLVALEKKLSTQSPSTAKGARGKDDIIKGLRLIVTSNNSLIKDFKKSAKGKAVATATIKLAIKAADKGNADLVAGTRLLKV